MSSDQNRSTLGNPFFLGSLGLLVLNDQFLKSHFGNSITGKLSDFAGLFVVGFLVAAMARRHEYSEQLALLPIAIIFSAAKTIPAITNAIVGGLDLLLPWSNSVVTDPSDLIALVVMPLAPRALDQGTIQLRSWVKNGLILTTVFACTATSQLKVDPVNLGVTQDGQVVTAHDRDLHLGTTVDIEAEIAVTAEPIMVPKDTFENRAPKNEACANGDISHCFRINLSGTIEESVNGGEHWSTIWKIAPDSYATIAGARLEAISSETPLAPRDLEITTGGDLTAIVGDSTLVTRTVDGVWTNPDSSFRPWTLPLLIQLLLTSIVFYVAIALGLEMFKPKVLWAWIPTVAAATFSLMFGVSVADPGLPMFELAAMLLVGFCGFLVVLSIRRSKIANGPALALGLVAPPFLTLIAAIPLGVWKYANISTFEAAAVLSALATLVLAGLIYLATRQVDRNTIPPTPKVPAHPWLGPPPAI